MSDAELLSLIRQAKETRLLNPSDPECSPEVYVNHLAAVLAVELEKRMGDQNG